jgi:choline-sulfatase
MRVLILDLDTLRPDHLGCYGYHRNTSPNIDRIAAEGVRFTNYYCSDAPCLPSRAALMSGQFGIHSGVVGHGGTAGDRRLEGSPRGFRDKLAQGVGAQSLPMVFRREGYRTASISPFAERHSAWWFNAGFTEMHNTGKGGMESAEEVTPTVLKWINDNATEDNWLLHVNYWDPHAYYRAPEEFGNPFGGEPLPDWFNEDVIAEHRKMVGPNTARELNMYNADPVAQYPRHVSEIRDMEDLRKHIDGADCGIAYVDQHVGMLFDALEAQGALDDLAIIITSDHGENQGELGIYKEHGTADQITCRIPMIIRWPGGVKGHVDTGFHYNLDLAPTLAELFGQKPIADWDGRSYAGTIMNGAELGRDSLVLSQCAHVCQRSVRFGPHLYIRTYHDGYHLFPTEMLFNLEQDPHEQHDLAPERPDLCREAVYLLNQWHDEMMHTMPDAVDPLWTVIREGGPTHARGFLPAYCERLEKTDRAWAVPELKRRHPGEFAWQPVVEVP